MFECDEFDMKLFIGDARGCDWSWGWGWGWEILLVLREFWTYEWIWFDIILALNTFTGLWAVNGGYTSFKLASSLFADEFIIQCVFIFFFLANIFLPNYVFTLLFGAPICMFYLFNYLYYRFLGDGYVFNLYSLQNYSIRVVFFLKKFMFFGL